MRLNRGLQFFRRHGFSVGLGEHFHLETVGLCHLHPAFTELACGTDDHPVAGREEVRDRRLHRAASGSREESDAVLRAHEVVEVLDHSAIHVTEVLRAVVQVGTSHRAHCRREQGRGTGRQQAVLADMHVLLV